MKWIKPEFGPWCSFYFSPKWCLHSDNFSNRPTANLLSQTLTTLQSILTTKSQMFFQLMSINHSVQLELNLLWSWHDNSPKCPISVKDTTFSPNYSDSAPLDLPTNTHIQFITISWQFFLYNISCLFSFPQLSKHLIISYMDYYDCSDLKRLTPWL